MPIRFADFQQNTAVFLLIRASLICIFLEHWKICIERPPEFDYNVVLLKTLQVLQILLHIPTLA